MPRRLELSLYHHLQRTWRYLQRNYNFLDKLLLYIALLVPRVGNPLCCKIFLVAIRLVKWSVQLLHISATNVFDSATCSEVLEHSSLLWGFPSIKFFFFNVISSHSFHLQKYFESSYLVSLNMPTENVLESPRFYFIKRNFCFMSSKNSVSLCQFAKYSHWTLLELLLLLTLLAVN